MQLLIGQQSVNGILNIFGEFIEFILNVLVEKNLVFLLIHHFIYRKMLGTKEVTVAVTPNGYADGVAVNKTDGQEYFVMPEEQTMTMNEFLDKLDDDSPRLDFR